MLNKLQGETQREKELKAEIIRKGESLYNKLHRPDEKLSKSIYESVIDHVKEKGIPPLIASYIDFLPLPHAEACKEVEAYRNEPAVIRWVLEKLYGEKVTEWFFAQDSDALKIFESLPSLLRRYAQIQKKSDNKNVNDFVISWRYADLSSRLRDYVMVGCSRELKGRHCEYVNFYHQFMSIRNFSGANFLQANFCHTALMYSTFEKSDLRNASFRFAELRDMNFRQANLQNADFQSSRFVERGNLFFELHPMWHSWRKSINEGYRRLLKEEWENEQGFYENISDFEGADLRRANFRQARLCLANFQNTNLEYANFQEADLFRVDFRGAAFERTQFQHAKLEEANLQGTNPRSVDLSYANLEKADLAGADLRGTKLTGANFRGANLKRTILDNHEDFGNDCNGSARETFLNLLKNVYLKKFFVWRSYRREVEAFVREGEGSNQPVVNLIHDLIQKIKGVKGSDHLINPKGELYRICMFCLKYDSVENPEEVMARLMGIHDQPLQESHGDNHTNRRENSALSLSNSSSSLSTFFSSHSAATILGHSSSSMGQRREERRPSPFSRFARSLL